MSAHYRDAVAALFKASPGVRISAYALMDCGGKMAWRTRVSECRRLLGMDITCTVERDAKGQATSWYTYTPKAQPAQADLFQRAS